MTKKKDPAWLLDVLMGRQKDLRKMKQIFRKRANEPEIQAQLKDIYIQLARVNHHVDMLKKGLHPWQQPDELIQTPEQLHEITGIKPREKKDTSGIKW